MEKNHFVEDDVFDIFEGVKEYVASEDEENALQPMEDEFSDIDPLRDVRHLDISDESDLEELLTNSEEYEIEIPEFYDDANLDIPLAVTTKNRHDALNQDSSKEVSKKPINRIITTPANGGFKRRPSKAENIKDFRTLFRRKTDRD